MSVSIACFEAHGIATGGVPELLTQVTNCNLKVSADPAQHYYLNDLQRPTGALGKPQANFTFTRYFTFRVTGSFTRVKNIRIRLNRGYSANDWRISYGLRTSYSPPGTNPNEFAVTSGRIDGTLQTLTEPTIIYPMLHQGASLSSPVWTRDIWYNNSAPIWTQYLVLQGAAHGGAFDDVSNIGCESIFLELDEMEI